MRRLLVLREDTRVNLIVFVVILLDIVAVLVLAK
jgi:hypothetical protein